ncbi:hypothetical protein IC582_004288 [Cucumis melo]|uniref:DUF6821 domain-containing protein n=2 Tax=Cucumis melo TaxID=3656 RepID=A0A5A7T6D7_CUCMM|nr:uncharacterized protein LOC103485392 [Cucumis melo]KAA0037045.1 uncharacterized protein E6C27_scaffold86G001400 [Cucumis melo var. makuwa]TYK06606.1 uncharacterized protein E5676_scaffold453G00740 [Cucumis melo var. makuwa]
MDDEFQDWELLHEYDRTFPQPYSSNLPDSNSRFFQEIEGDSGSESTICLDYFSLRKHEPSSKTPLKSTVTDECLVEPENLSSVDSGSENRSCRKNTSEIGSDLGNDLLGECELNQSHANGLLDITKSVAGFEEISTDAENLNRREADDGELKGSPLVARDEPLRGKDTYNPTESEESSEESESQDEILDDTCSNWSGNMSFAMKAGDDGKENDAGNDHIESVNDISNNGDGDSSEKIDVAMAVEEVKVEAKSGELEAQRRKAVWWKVPFQVLRYCFLRASPAWSFSVAAAFMGVMILGRRLYKMKRKAKSLHLKIAVNDKNVSQFADRAARLNEAFSVVRRVPVVRAPLTGGGANSWPALSMR